MRVVGLKTRWARFYLDMVGALMVVAALIAVSALESALNLLSAGDFQTVLVTLTAILLAVAYSSVRDYAVLRVEGAYRDLLSRLGVQQGSILLPAPSSIEYGELEMYVFKQRSKYLASIRFKPRSRGVGAKIGFKPNGPQAFSFRIVASLQRDLYYRGPAYRFTYRGADFLAVPVYPAIPTARNNVVSVASGGDVGNAEMVARDGEAEIKVTYIKDRSRSLKLLLRGDYGNPAGSVFEAQIARWSEPGGYITRVSPTLKEVCVLILPENRVFLEIGQLDPPFVSEVAESWFRNVSAPSKHSGGTVFLGFDDAELVLSLDIPFKRDVEGGVKLSSAYVPVD